MSCKLRVGQAGFCGRSRRLMVIHERPWPLATFGDNLTITVGQGGAKSNGRGMRRRRGEFSPARTVDCRESLRLIETKLLLRLNA
jgi:hypothetical protein